MALLTKNGIVHGPRTTLEIARRTKENIRPLSHVVREAIESALILCEGDRMEAASRLGMSRASIYRRIKEFSWT